MQKFDRKDVRTVFWKILTLWLYHTSFYSKFLIYWLGIFKSITQVKIGVDYS